MAVKVRRRALGGVEDPEAVEDLRIEDGVCESSIFRSCGTAMSSKRLGVVQDADALQDLRNDDGFCEPMIL